jgi:hypothetical protein
MESKMTRVKIGLRVVRSSIRAPCMILQDVEKRFLRIIVNRLGWYLDKFSRTGGGFLGAGWMVLWEPLLVQKMVDTMWHNGVFIDKK